MLDHPFSLRLLRLSSLLFAWLFLAGSSVAPLWADFETPTRQTLPQSVTAAPTPAAPASEHSPASADGVWAAWDALSPDLRAKVDARILDELRGAVLPAHLGSAPFPAPGKEMAPAIPRQQTRFVVYLRSAADVGALDQTLDDRVYASQADRRRALVDTLRADAESSQADLRRLLAARSTARQGKAPGVTAFQPFFIVNAIAVEGDLATLIELTQRADVGKIVANYPLFPVMQTPEDSQAADRTPDERRAEDERFYEWNLRKVQADRVHSELGIRGSGAVVGGFDTGVNYRHPALQRQYRGNQNGVMDHNYNWFVPDGNLYANGNFGASVTSEPSDCASSTHGTHTMGTMVGDAGGRASVIGMAPDARWIAVPGICNDTMPGGIQDDIGGIKAFQWFLCPTDLTGTLASANCSKAPDVVNNSWGSANPADDTFRPILQILRLAGVAPVFASGNPSAGPGSIGAPANAPEAITVGATTSFDNLSYFSGQGPSFYPGEQKPELSAPGSYVRSSVGSGSYDEYSGTSMAAPHVAGLIALLVSADLQDGVRDFDVEDMERLMALSAVDLGDPGPDIAFGYGRIDAYTAVQTGLTAGDLRGQVFDQEYNTPVAFVWAEAYHPATDRRFAAQADANGVYSLTLPAGDYQVTLSRWGYETTPVGSHRVVMGALTLNDFRILSRPQATVSGRIIDEAGPVANAVIYDQNNEAVQVRSGADGKYQISLPLGPGVLAVKSPKHRLAQQNIQLPGVGATVDFTLKKAPSILLVDTSPLGGWFLGWPVYRFFTRALDEENYQYDLWRVQYSSIFDTSVGSDGSTLYGLPSAATLKGYDLVIWVQSYCGDASCTDNSLEEIGAEPALIDFLDSGGRLFISGQDLGYADKNNTLFNVYLQAEYVADYGARSGTTLTASDFLAGLDLKLTNASLYGYANGALYYSPDAVAPRPGGFAFPVLSYEGEDNNSQARAAALAVAPCNASYRAFYLASGLENVAPRAGQSQPDWTRLLDASIAWLDGETTSERYVLAASEENGSGVPGEEISYSFSIANLSKRAMRFTFDLRGNEWPGQILLRGIPVTAPIDLPACSSTLFSLEVDIPYGSALGSEDTAILTVSSPGLPSGQRNFHTRHAAQWRAAEPLPLNRNRMSTVALKTSYHVIGGDGYSSSSDDAGTDHQRYDPCAARWESRAPLPEARESAASAAIGHRLFLAGGRAESREASDTLFIYDTGTDSWSQGAPMPRALYRASGASVGGKFYVFGGYDGLESSKHFLVYDPVQNRWQDLGEMPGGSLYYAASAASNGAVYLLDGLSLSDTFVRYTPATNTWTVLSRPRRLRFGAVLVATPGDFLYLMGGEGGGTLVERYDPATDTWSDVNFTIKSSRYLAGAAYVEGKIYLVGGSSGGISHESLRLAGSLCESALIDQQTAVHLNGEIVYTFEIQTSDREQPNTRLVAPLHPGQRFVGFGENTIGAVYSANHAVEWTGTVPANARPLRLSYTAGMIEDAWQVGDRITHTLRLQSENGPTLTASTAALFFAPDFSASTKEASRAAVAAGIPFTYTVDLRSYTPVGGSVSFTDTLPSTLDFVPDSLTAGSGTASYDPASHTVNWSGTAGQGRPGFVNLESRYIWTDTLGEGLAPAPVFAWRDIRDTGLPVVSGVDTSNCNLPVGFDFPLFGESYSSVCVDVNGLLTFGEFDYYNPDSYNDCPMRSGRYALPRIAGLWTSMAVDDSVYMQTFGEAPRRYTVFQWTDARYWSAWGEFFGISNPPDTDFQIVVYEDGRVQLLILRMGSIVRQFSTTGLTGPDVEESVTYQCDDSLPGMRDPMAVEFLPPGGYLGTPNEPISFQMIPQLGTPINSVVTNTVTIQSGAETYTRSVGLLVQSVDLSSSAKTASRSDILLGESVAYTVTLGNSGQAVAQETVLADTLPAGLTFTPGSLVCSRGACSESGGTIRWQGSLPPGESLVLTYRATLDTVLPDKTPLTNTAQIGAAGVSDLLRSAVVYARGTNLGASTFDFGGRPNEPGDRFTLSMLVRNTGIQGTNADVSLPLPAELSYLPGTLRCGIGQCRADGGRILWSGTLPPRGLVAVEMDVRLAEGLASGQRIPLSAQITDNTSGLTQTVSGGMFVAFHLFMPGVRDDRQPPIFLPLVIEETNGVEAVPVTPTPTQTAASPVPTPTPTPSGR